MKQLSFSLLITSFFICSYAGAQISENVQKEQKWFSMMEDPSVNFYDVQREAEAYFKDKSKGRGSGYKIYKRWENMNYDRTFPSGRRPMQNHLWDEMEKFKSNHTSRKIVTSNWEELGPKEWTNNTGHWNPGIGRINVIEVDPNDKQTIYIGAPSGGCWKTTNEGETWEVLTDNLPVMGVSAIAVDPNNSDIVYIGTGDRDAGDNYSIGVLKSTDGGQSWNICGLEFSINQNRTVEKLLINPDNTDIIYCSVNNGLYKSIDAGDSWETILNGHIDDLEFKPGDPNTIYASTTKLYISRDGGETFVENENVPGSGRIQIAVTEANPEYLYWYSSGSGIYRSEDSGETWEKRCNKIDNGSQHSYDLAIAVSHDDPEEVHTGLFNTMRSMDGGQTWTLTTDWTWGNSIGYTHCDIHWLHCVGSTLYCGSDGLISKSEDSGETWTNMTTGIGIRQFYRIGGSKNHPYKLIGGSQDNGTSVYTTNFWHEWLGADGMECLIDYTDENIVYGTIQYGQFYKSNSGGENTIDITQPGPGHWVTPFVIHPTDPNTLYVGVSGVRKTTDGMQTWETISDFSGSTRQMAISESNPDYIFASRDNNIWRTKDGGESWSSIKTGLPEKAISYIAVHPSKPETIAVTLSGFSTGEKLYISYNAGENWENHSLNLPNIPANCITFYDSPENPIYVGMDVGIYYTDKSLDQYETFWNGLPNVIVNELEINYQINKIRAGTYGRGIWESDIRFNAPISEFDADYTSIPTGHYVNFSSQSSGPPTTFEWNFEGGTPSSSTEKNPQNIYYQTEGTFDVTLNVSNDLGNHSITKEEFILSSATLMPQVKISTDKNSICNGESIQLFDETDYFPISWEWIISPQTFIFTEGTDANSQNPKVEFSEDGAYTITLKASNSNGESTGVFTNYIHVGGQPIPFIDDFEDKVLEDYWTIINEDNNETWKIVEVGGNEPGNTAIMMNFREVMAVGQIDQLISQPFDLSSNTHAYLGFNHAYAKYHESVTDSLIIHISSDCGESWTRIFAAGDDGEGSFATTQFSGVNFVPSTTEDWCGSGYGSDCINIDISEWAGQNEIKLKFETSSYFGNPIYIDNIQVNSVPVGIQSLDEPKAAIYPNPNNGVFALSLGVIKESTNVLITNTLGKVVLSLLIEDGISNIDLSSQPAGVYFINISTSTTNQQIKFVKD